MTPWRLLRVLLTRLLIRELVNERSFFIRSMLSSLITVFLITCCCFIACGAITPLAAKVGPLSLVNIATYRKRLLWNRVRVARGFLGMFRKQRASTLLGSGPCYQGADPKSKPPVIFQQRRFGPQAPPASQIPYLNI